MSGKSSSSSSMLALATSLFCNAFINPVDDAAVVVADLVVSLGVSAIILGLITGAEEEAVGTFLSNPLKELFGW